jgi:DNA repair protein RecN (Recombination protein N)
VLRALSIRDYVIVDRLDLELADGFTALTGETGAGKSILVDALGLALGGRADAGVVRTGAQRAEVSADFDVEPLPGVREWLGAQEFDEGDGACILRRTVDMSGRSRGFVNGRPATAAQLRELGEMLVDIHGQHEHQQLLRRDRQRLLLDAFGGSEELARRVAGKYGDWRRLAEQRAARQTAQASSARERELLVHEIHDLEALAFDPRQWAQDQAEHRRLGHAQELIDAVTECAEALDDAEDSATSRLGHALARLTSAAELDPALEDARRDAEAASVHAGEAAQQLHRYLQKLEVDPARLSQLDSRIKAVLETARKHRVEPLELSQVLEERHARLAELGGDESLEELKAKEAAAEREFRALAGELTKARRASAKKLGAEVTRTMQTLAMAGGRLEVALEPLEQPTSGGLEAVELRVAAHAGQELAPLAKVASGGELSRISLAIQVLLSGQASVPTLIFDEVDSGIGGAVAEVVGRLLAGLSKHLQVLSVTHLAQVAVHARAQLRVAKQTRGNITLAAVDPLSATERVEEMARLLGGHTITEATRRHASEMLQSARDGGISPPREKKRVASGPR